VLFLADRIELAKQAKETFDDYLRDYPTTILYRGRRSLEGQIVVGTLDTIAGRAPPGSAGRNRTLGITKLEKNFLARTADRRPTRVRQITRMPSCARCANGGISRWLPATNFYENG